MSDELEQPDDDDLPASVEESEAGWYVDPDDPSMIRWWDGDEWTDFRRELDEVDEGDEADEADDADDAGRRPGTRIAVAAALAVGIGLTAWVATRPSETDRRDPPAASIEQLSSGPGTPVWTTVTTPGASLAGGRTFRSGDGSLTMVVPAAWRRVDPQGRVVAWSVVDGTGVAVGRLTVEIVVGDEPVGGLVPVANALAEDPDPDVNLLGSTFDHVMYPAPDSGATEGRGGGGGKVARMDYRTSSVLGTTASGRAWTRLASTDAGARQVIVRLLTTPELFERATIAAEPYSSAAIVRVP